jgi:Fe-S oxidoreductase
LKEGVHVIPSSQLLFGFMPGQLVFILLFGAALYWFIKPLYDKIRWIRGLGRPAPDTRGNVPQRLKNALIQVLGQTKVIRTSRGWAPGVMHAAMFYGFLVMQLNNLGIIIEGVVPAWHINFGPIYALIDTFYILVALGCVVFAYIRYVKKPARLSQGMESLNILLFIFGLVVTELGAETMHTAINGHASSFAYLSNALVPLFSGLSPEAAQLVYNLFWWGHMAVLASFMYYLPRSKHLHLLLAPVNLYFNPYNERPRGQMTHIDLEDENAESFGVSKLEEFTWKDLLDVMTCIECGRCQDNCPAYMTGKPLSPKKIIVDLKHHLYERGPLWALLAQSTGGEAAVAGAAAAGGVTLTEAQQAILNKKLIGDVITTDEIWSCTTCNACVEACPLGIDPMSKITDMRRSLTMMEGDFPSEVNVTFRNLEKQGNPWGLGAHTRMAWAEGLDVKTVDETLDAEYVYYVGCAGSFDQRSQKIARAVVQLLQKAGVSFALLGKHEKCNGDLARRIGNEMLFQQLAMENIETMKAFGVKKVITHCPHCFNTIGNEYKQFGFEVETVHHTQLLAKLVAEGKLKPEGTLAERVAFHDSCYLARYNDEVDAPRQILQAIPGLELLEMANSGKCGTCCGAGGGRMWMEEHLGNKKVNIERTEQAMATNPTAVASNCPFCLTMLKDGLLEVDSSGKVGTYDVAELLLQVIDPDTGKAIKAGVQAEAGD